MEDFVHQKEQTTADQTVQMEQQVMQTDLTQEEQMTPDDLLAAQMAAHELIRAEKEQVELRKLAQREYQPPLATQAAIGSPYQHLKYHKLSPKNRLKQHFVHKKAQKKATYVTPVGHMVRDALNDRGININNAMERFYSRIQTKGIDPDVLSAFCVPYRINTKGRPATRREEHAKEANDQFMNDYLSGDVKLRWRHLDRAVDSVSEIQFSQNMINANLLSRNISQYSDICDQVLSVKEMINDPVNAPYFESLSEERRGKLQAIVNSRAAYALHDVITHYSAYLGICKERNADPSALPYDFYSDEDYQNAARHYPYFVDSCNTFTRAVDRLYAQQA